MILRHRHFLVRKLDAQIPARDHDAIRRGDQLGQVLERLVLFDLRDQQRGRLLHRRPRRGDVLRAADETERDVVDALGDRELQIL